MNYHLQQSEEISVNFEQEKPDTDDKVVYDPINKYFPNWQQLTCSARSQQSRYLERVRGWWLGRAAKGASGRLVVFYFLIWMAITQVFVKIY